MNLEATTARDRLTIDDAVGPFMLDIERAMRVLGMTIERYFSDRQDRDIPDHLAQHLYDELMLVHGALHDAAIGYELTIGNGRCPHVAQTLEAMDRVKLAIEVNDLRTERELEALRSGGSTEDLQRLAELPDGEAFRILSGSGENDEKENEHA